MYYLTKLFKAFLIQESKIATRNSLNISILFITIIFIFQLVLPDNSNIKNKIWLSILISIYYSLNNLFYNDYNNGNLEQLSLQGRSMHVILSVKLFTYWLFNGFFIALASAIFLYKNIYDVAAIIIATINLTAIAMLLSALSLNITQSGPLIAILSMPLSIPTILLGIISSSNIGYIKNLALLTAFTIPTCIFLTTISIKDCQ